MAGNGTNGFNPDDRWAQRAVAVGRLATSALAVGALAYGFWLQSQTINTQLEMLQELCRTVSASSGRIIGN